MLWKDALALLGSSPIVVLQQNCNPDYLFVEHLDRCDRALSSDTLYFATLSSLCRELPQERPPEPKQLSVVLLCDGELPPALAALFNNIVCLYTVDAFLAAFQLLRESLQESIRFNSRLQEFMELVAMEDGLDRLVQWIADFYGHPVGLLDNSFTYIALSRRDGFAAYGSAELMRDVENGYVCPEHFQHIQEQQNLNMLHRHSSDPVLITPAGQDFKHYHVPILIGSTTAGAFSLFLRPNEDLPPLGRLYLKKIARLISIVLQRMDFYSTNKSSFYTTFFSAMLDGVPDPSQRWESRLAAYGCPLLPSLHIIAAYYPKAAQRRSELQNLATSLHHIFPGSIYCVRGNLIVLLCSDQPGRFSDSYVASRGDSFFARNDLKIGISSEFHSIYDMASYYQEAVTAIQLGSRFDPDGHFYLYDNLRLYDMINRVARDNDLMSFCYPPFMKLFQYDRENGTELGPTLYLYLLDIKDPSRVCGLLNIHKNTLYFRLKKIQSIMQVDYTRLPVAAKIFVTIIILRHTGQISERAFDLSEVYLDAASLKQALPDGPETKNT